MLCFSGEFSVSLLSHQVLIVEADYMKTATFWTLYFALFGLICGILQLEVSIMKYESTILVYSSVVQVQLIS